jgi:hypothetical protein
MQASQSSRLKTHTPHRAKSSYFSKRFAKSTYFSKHLQNQATSWHDHHLLKISLL